MRVRQNDKLFSSALVAAWLLVTAGTVAAQDVRYAENRFLKISNV
jgi:hypothetical protein